MKATTPYQPIYGTNQRTQEKKRKGYPRKRKSKPLVFFFPRISVPASHPIALMTRIISYPIIDHPKEQQHLYVYNSLYISVDAYNRIGWRSYRYKHHLFLVAYLNLNFFLWFHTTTIATTSSSFSSSSSSSSYLDGFLIPFLSLI